ncbi:Polyketide biosynthesis 3-hydroxy-3-methylglutaryl-ACP synthase PksG (plasmid) [Streptomyces sp. YIM 121038]|uniref:hydroxymethylglutaryl-CoA synthase family protein n=1 Tax=Streptomyces sp. YIM 121038 TaxID=2136401 RepID=UPI001110FB0B|nr:hydroxymethylglutaryl-CoA synthase [Streptomyces sp. YIM 121038]QCX82552.1 Polyketide biosynthesis 3-hydroxy-3-methylglutaryl-ACP synthase PksG [Streptomyces sp. YIM 121038]
MRRVGIEAINAYCGLAWVDVAELLCARGLDASRLPNLMMERRSVSLPCEDVVTYAVNAAQPVIAALSPAQRGRVELLLVATESGIDFSKAVSSWVHDLLGLSRRCRVLEVKQACYAGTGALQLAAAAVAASPVRGALALVVTADVPVAKVGTYHEPAQAPGGVAVLVSDQPAVASLDHGANGLHSFHVMDAYRPEPDLDIVDTDLSLMTYLECLQGSFADYARKVVGADFVTTFDLLVMHTPFPGMVKGAHRMLLHRLGKAGDVDVEADFAVRAEPSIQYARQVGNPYSGSVLLALASAITHAPVAPAQRIGVFSYGSGCGSEFYSMVITPQARKRVSAMGIDDALRARHRVDPASYDALCAQHLPFGTHTASIDMASCEPLLNARSAPLLLFTGVAGYHRQYEWWGGQDD